ncbi:MAG: hypothetical protein F4Z25_06990, partial [Chloroflexi bacterium]|nr:hypothetical protein [Chloroflexota bacterium]
MARRDPPGIGEQAARIAQQAGEFLRRAWDELAGALEELAARTAALRRRLAARRRAAEPEALADREARQPDVPRRRRGPRLPGAATIVAEREDDASSIIGRIDAASEVELLLVVPRRAYELRSAVEWLRLAASVRPRRLPQRVLARR